MRTHWHLKAAGLATAVACLGAALAFASDEPRFLLLAGIACIAAYAVAWHAEPLCKTSTEQVRATRVYGNVVVIVAACTVAVWLAFFA